MTFNPTSEEIKKYRDENEVGLLEAKERLIKKNLISHLQGGGTAEPVLLFMLKEWFQLKE